MHTAGGGAQLVRHPGSIRHASSTGLTNGAFIHHCNRNGDLAGPGGALGAHWYGGGTCIPIPLAPSARRKPPLDQRYDASTGETHRRHLSC
jgi:hypothetical protein